MNIAIIGSGWLAHPLAMQLQSDGHQVILTTTTQDKVVKLQAQGLNALQYVLGDQLSEPSQLFDVDAMLIAITSKDIEAFDILLDQLSEHACQHVLYISSTSVYQNDGTEHDENSQRLNQSNPLLAIESLMQSHPSASIIRFAGLVGPNRHPGHFFKSGQIVKNPEAPVNLIHLDDCIGIISAVIEQGAWGEIFNGCAETHPTKLEFYGHAAKLLDLAEPKFDNSRSTGSHKVVCKQKIKTVLNYNLIHQDVMNMTY